MRPKDRKNRPLPGPDDPENEMARKRWDRFTIKAEVHRRKSTLTKIATDAKLDPSACRSALIRRHFAGEKALAAFLGLEPADLWPDRYETPSSGTQDSACRTGATSQNVHGRPDMGAAA